MDEFVVEGTLGVNDLNKLEMIIYPNPVEIFFFWLSLTQKWLNH